MKQSRWGESAVIRPDNTLTVKMVCKGLNEEQIEALWQPFFGWVKSLPDDYTMPESPGFGSSPARHWWDAEYRKKHSPHSQIADPRPGAPPAHVWWSGNQDEVGIFMHGYESAWLPASLLQKHNQVQLIDALLASSRSYEVQLHFNKGLAGSTPEALAAGQDTAMNPAVLDAFALVIIAGGGPPAYPGLKGHEPDVVRARKDAIAIDKAMAELRKVVPEPGSYVSESNYFDRAWQQSFWGVNYPRLEKVKAKYDPDGLFFVRHGVGSEGWSDDGFTRSLQVSPLNIM